MTKHLSLIFIGLGIGWLVALSVSPIISTIITSIVGVVITLLSALSGLTTQKDSSEKTGNPDSRPLWQVDPVPLSLIIIGIVMGSIVGISVRSHNLLGVESRVDVQSEIKKWENAGIAKIVVAERLFEREYPSKDSSSKPVSPQSSKDSSSKSVSPDISMTVLFGLGHNECNRLLIFSREELPEKLKSSTIAIFKDLPNTIYDSEVLEKVVKSQCEKIGK